MYVLASMVVTFSTCQVERLPMKAPALENTAPHTVTKQSPRIKMDGEKKRRENIVHVMYKNIISARTK